MYNSREKGKKSGDLALVWIGADRGRVATEINGLELCGINPRILGCFRCVRRRNKTYNKKKRFLSSSGKFVVLEDRLHFVLKGHASRHISDVLTITHSLRAVTSL